MKPAASLLVLLLASLLAACAAPAPRAAAEAARIETAGSEPAAAYRLQPGDILLVSVWKEQDLQSEVLIRPDGRLSFPLAGEVAAAGHTIDELRTELAERLRHYIPDASVTVSMKVASGNKIYVVGKVNHPGEFPLNRPIDVMQALGLAGGTTTFADLDGISVLRQGGERSSAMRFRYSQVAHGQHLEQNVLLRSGDTIVVP